MMEEQDPVLPLSLVNRDEFLNLFYDPVTLAVQLKANLHLHVLRVDGGDFAVGQLYKALANATLGYVLSRQNMERFNSDRGRTVEWVNKVQAQFKRPEKLAGEGGEVLLYSFLEGHLNAPKILSKMELKTSPEHYVHGSDGVHLLQVGDKDYQLIFGESKMYADLNQGIKAALTSVAKVQDDSFDFDTWLVQSELLKESLSSEKLEILEAILLPTARGTQPVRKTNAFGVFIGYEIDATALKFEDFTGGEIETELRKLAEDKVRAEIDTIKKEIVDRGLDGCYFHMYAVPFVKRIVKGKVRGIDKVRFDLATALGNKEGKGL